MVEAKKSSGMWTSIVVIVIVFFMGYFVGQYVERQNNPINKVENLLKDL